MGCFQIRNDVMSPKSEDIIYIREIFPGTTPMAPGGLPWDGEPSESAALVMPSVVAAGQRLSLPVDVALTLQRVSVLEVCRAGGSDNGATPSRRAKAGGRTWWKGCRAPPPAWSRPVTTALWGSSVCQGRSAANPPGQRRGGLGLGQGFERLRQGVGRCGQLAALPIDDYARLPVRFVDSMIHDGDIIDLSALVLVH